MILNIKKAFVREWRKKKGIVEKSRRSSANSERRCFAPLRSGRKGRNATGASVARSQGVNEIAFEEGHRCLTLI